MIFSCCQWISLWYYQVTWPNVVNGPVLVIWTTKGRFLVYGMTAPCLKLFLCYLDRIETDTSFSVPAMVSDQDVLLVGVVDHCTHPNTNTSGRWQLRYNWSYFYFCKLGIRKRTLVAFCYYEMGNKMGECYIHGPTFCGSWLCLLPIYSPVHGGRNTLKLANEQSSNQPEDGKFASVSSVIWPTQRLPMNHTSARHRLAMGLSVFALAIFKTV